MDNSQNTASNSAAGASQTPQQVSPSPSSNQTVQPQVPNLETSQICIYCKVLIPKDVYFCPNCGKKLKDPPLSTSITKQIGLYFFAVLMPPFGIIPGIRYLRQKEQKAQIIGTITILLTVISLALTVYYTMQIFSLFSTDYTKQLAPIQNQNF